jgi:hypothetical protein
MPAGYRTYSEAELAEIDRKRQEEARKEREKVLKEDKEYKERHFGKGGGKSRRKSKSKSKRKSSRKSCRRQFR